jgi:hypothetical protein
LICHSFVVKKKVKKKGKEGKIKVFIEKKRKDNPRFI